MSLMYMVQLKYTKDALMAIIDQQQDRMAAAEALCESVGGKLHGCASLQTLCGILESQRSNTAKSVCFIGQTTYRVDLPGNDPQKPPGAASPEPRLNILGAL